MDITGLMAATGMPSGKKTHRGKRSRGHGPKPEAPKHEVHLAAVNEAMEQGDHPKAKSSALSLVKALHSLTKKPAPDAPAMELPPVA